MHAGNNQIDSPTESSSNSSKEHNLAVSTLVPGRPDFIMSYATLPGATAYRDRETGSLHVQELVKWLSQGLEIDRALKLVSQGVAEELKKRDVEDRMSRFQLPFHLTSGMNKLLTL